MQSANAKIYDVFTIKKAYEPIQWGQNQSRSFLVSQQQRQQIFPDQQVAITILLLLVLWEMNLKVSVSTESPDTANKLKSIGLSLVFTALGNL